MKKYWIIWNDTLPFKGYKAMALWPWVFVRNGFRFAISDRNLSWQTTYYLYTSNKSTVTSLNITNYDAVEFVLCTSTASSTTSPAGIVDRETIPVVSDGEDGADGIGGIYLSSHDSYFARNNSGTSAPTSGWGTSVLEPTSSQRYVWRKDVWTYSASETGRNLMRGTKAPKMGGSATTSWSAGTLYYSGSGGSITTDTSQTPPIADIENSMKITKDSTTTEYGFAQGELPLKTGKLTMSCWIKGTNGAVVRIQPAWANSPGGVGSLTHTCNGEWERISYTGTVSTATNYRIGYIYLTTAYATLYVCGMKVEYGDAPTDWCVAPEDLYKEEISVCSVYGESPWIADLDNEMDSISCGDDGYPVEEQTVSTKLSMYYGSTPKNFKVTGVSRNGTSLTNGTASNGMTASWSTASSTSITLTVKYATSAKINGKDDIAITLRPDDATSMVRTLHFTVNGFTGDVYNLLPSTNAITFAVNSVNNYTPTSWSVTCVASKKNLDGSTTDGTTAYGIDNRLNIYWHGLLADGTVCSQDGTVAGSQKWWSAWKSDKSPLSISIPSSTNAAAIEFVLTSAASYGAIAGSNIIDRETIPIVKSGKKGNKGEKGDQGDDGEQGPQGPSGKDAAVMTTTPSMVSYKANPDGSAIGEQRFYPVIKIMVNGTSQTAGNLSLTTLSGVSWNYVAASSNSIYLTIANGASPNGTITVTGSATINGIPYTASASIAVFPERRRPVVRGPRVWSGNSVRYQSGELGESYIDVVIYNGNYYQCISTHTSSSSSTPSPSGSSYWQVASDFGFIASGLVLAEQALIKNLIVEELKALKEEGRTTLDYAYGTYSHFAPGVFEIGTYQEMPSLSGDDKLRYTPRYEVTFKIIDSRRIPVISFYDENGNKIGDIDESIFSKVETVADTWNMMNLIYYGTSAPSPSDTSIYNTYRSNQGSTFYQYWEGYQTNLNVRSYTIGKRTGATSYDKTAHNGSNGRWQKDMNTNNFKLGLTSTTVYASSNQMQTGYYIKAGPYKQTKTGSNGAILMRMVMDVYKCDIDKPDGGTYYYSGILTKYGTIGTAWEDSGMVPVESQ